MAVVVTHSTPADGTFSATGAAAWNANHTLSGLGTMAEQNANNVNITGGSISGVTGVATSGTNSDITSLTGLTTPLSVAQGGSGTATPSLVAGTNITISGSWPNQTINATASGSVTSVTASSPLASTGGGTPDISLSGVITGANGGTGINNGSKTITLGGNLTTSGAFNTTLTATNTTSLTMPVSGTLISSVTNMAANPVTGTPSASNYLRGDGTWAAIPAASLVVNTTPTSGGAAGQIMFDTGSVLQESSNFVWDDANGGLTVSSIANPTIPSLTINGASNYTGATLSGVAITGTGGQFSCNATTLTVGKFVTISGTFGGTGSITGYANPTTYRISATNGTTTFTLVNATTGAAIVTTAGTPTGLTYTVTGPFINLSQTWNNSVVAFRGLQYNVTDTASNASSLLMDLQVGGSSRFNVAKNGGTFITTTDSNGVGLTISGPSSTPAVVASNSPFRNGSIVIGFNLNGGTGVAFSSSNNGASPATGTNITGFIASSGTSYSFASGILASTPDTFLTRRAAANLRFGAADAAAPVAQTLSVQSVVAGTSNTAGANLTITGSQGTGTGAGGDIIFQTALAGSSGTAQNTLITGLRIYSNQTVVVGKAYTVATLPAAGTQGRRAWVTDATVPTFLGALTGGGAVVCPVFDNGTAWVAG